MVEKDRETGPSPFLHRGHHPDFPPSPHYLDNSSSKVLSPFSILRNSSVPPLAPLDYLQSQRRGSITDPSLHASNPPHLSRSTPGPSTRFDSHSTLRDPPFKPGPSLSRPMSPYKFGEGSSHLPDHSDHPHTQSTARRGSVDAAAGSSSGPASRDQVGHSGPSDTHANRVSKGAKALTHVSLDQGEPSGSTTSMIGPGSQAPPRGPGSPSHPHGTKRKLSHDRGISNPGGDEIDPQLIGPGVPSTMSVDMEGPSPKRRGSVADTRLAQNIFDRRHSLDARNTQSGPQWWSGDRRDSMSSMFSTPYGSPAFSVDSSHGQPPGATASFAVHATQPSDPSSSSMQTISPASTFNADRRMSVPTNLPSTMPAGTVASRALRSRSRPPSRASGRHRGSEQPSGDPSTLPSAGDNDSGGPESGSSSKDMGMTPYSRSPELRVSHKLAERKRRKEMKDLFDELRDQLPADRGMKASKWEILSKAIDFIVQLKQGHQDMGREIDVLRHELEGFRQGLPPFGPGGPHPMYPPGAPIGSGHFPPAGPGVPLQPPPSSNHQPASPRPGSSGNAYPSGEESGGAPAQNGDESATPAVPSDPPAP
ncbi:hypothetical protein BV25DRAFT_1910585 [Artomyces pyxidatus]|uniref:Uncharacterized protein n=1 Tax=Artomyces pyxidatus TaxID=48021 RepID=A0ACB8TKD7_9AGAM|nr:hypothetical protein BV25DRAFT_1910585 [Artomyces pyxidatus]